MPLVSNRWSTITFVLLATVCVRTAFAGDAPNAAATFEDALELIKQERGAEAVPILTRLAENRDARAQVVLGMAYSEGKWLPRDPVQAYVWLRSPNEGGLGSIHLNRVSKQANDLALRVGAGLGGAELIRADARVAEMAQARKLAWDESYARGLRGEIEATNVLDQTFPFREGCATGPKAKRCGWVARGDARPRCTGVIEAKPDVMSSASGKGARIVMPEVDGSSPHDAKTGVLVHVDWSGYVCYAKVFDSSGDAEADRAAVDAVSQWRLAPATKAGASVESRNLLYLTVNPR